MTEAAIVPPGLILVLSGLVMLVAPRPARAVLLVGAPLAMLAHVWFLAGGAAPIAEGPFAGETALVGTAHWLGLTLYPVRVDALGLLFATVFAIAGAAGGLYAARRENAKELAAMQIYAGSAVSAVLAGDLITLFVFWEIMAIASTVVIWSGGEGARAPGLRYAVIHFLGGALLMAGVAGYVHATGETAFTALPGEGIVAGLVLLAFLINSGAWPLNAWLPDAYPEASSAGTVYLQSFTTKTAIYALIRGFPGEEWLLWLGLATMLYGIVYALLETEIRRLLCHAIIVQSGFLLVAIGLGTDMTLNGAAGHTFVSILYSALLFMVAGAVMEATGKRHLSDLGGLARRMPMTALLAVVGGLCIAAFPGTGAYVSKSLISSGAGHHHDFWVWLALTAAGAGVMLHAGIRFQWVVFWGRNRGIEADDPPMSMQIAMIALAAVVIAIAVFWKSFYALLPHAVEYKPYKADALLAQAQLLVAAALAYLAARQILPERRGLTLDIDWLWRGIGAVAVGVIGERWVAAYQRWARESIRNANAIFNGLYRTHGPEGALARSRPSGYMAFWMTALLCLLLIFIVI